MANGASSFTKAHRALSHQNTVEHMQFEADDYAAVNLRR